MPTSLKPRPTRQIPLHHAFSDRRKISPTGRDIYGGRDRSPFPLTVSDIRFLAGALIVGLIAIALSLALGVAPDVLTFDPSILAAP